MAGVVENEKLGGMVVVVVDVLVVVVGDVCERHLVGAVLQVCRAAAATPPRMGGWARGRMSAWAMAVGVCARGARGWAVGSGVGL